MGKRVTGKLEDRLGWGALSYPRTSINRLVIFDHKGGHGPKEISQKIFHFRLKKC